MNTEMLNLNQNAMDRRGGKFSGYISNADPMVLDDSTATIYTLDCSKTNYFKVVMYSDSTIEIINVPSGSYTFIIEIANGGAFTITWPGSMQFSAGFTPTLSLSGTDIMVLNTSDQGNTFKGTVSIKDAK